MEKLIIYMKTDNRTKSQNNAYFLFQEMIAREMIDQWISLDKLVVEIKPNPTKDNLHIIFKWILEKMHNKSSTTNMTKEEMNWVLEVYMDALASINVNIYFPEQSKKTLLEFYN